jgi:hypothetical protein
MKKENKTKSISSSAQYVTLRIYFSHPRSFTYLPFFFSPTHKTETGIVNRWETTNGKPPGPISMMGQSETLSRSWIIFTLFSRCIMLLLCYSPPTTNSAIMLSRNYFPQPNQHILTFLHLILLCRII